MRKSVSHVLIKVQEAISLYFFPTYLGERAICSSRKTSVTSSSANFYQ